jgi:hypothetical protein
MSPDMAKKIERWPGLVRDFLLGALGIVCIVFALVSAINDKLQAAGTLFTAGLLLCIFSSLSRFESIKGLGVEAKMVALTNKIDEAELFLKHMRSMVGLMADTSFQIIGNMGRWDAEIPKAALLGIVERFQEQLTALGEPDTDIEKKLEPWHAANLRDLARPIYGALHQFVQFQNQLLTQESRNLPQDTSVQDPKRVRVDGFFDRNVEFLRRLDKIWNSHLIDFPRDIVRLIKDSSIGTPEELQWLLRQIEDALGELRYYIEQKTFKDKNAWLGRPYSWEIKLDFPNVLRP